MNHICPHCGAQLHENASFCPYCANETNQRTQLTPPTPFPKKILYLLIILSLLFAAVSGIFFLTRPATYDGQAEVMYKDNNGEYQLLLGYSNDRYTPVPEITQNAEKGEQYRFPVCLFINHEESGANAKEVFLKKVESITAEFGPSDSEENPLTCTKPAAHDYCTDAARIVFVDYIGDQNAAEETWTITMKNGDIIRLHQQVNVNLIKTYDYYPDTSAMNTTEELQTLLDDIAETVEPSAIVNVHLPAVTYRGTLAMEKRPVNLYGNTDGESRTVFTDTVRVASTNSYITYIDNVDFVGSSTSVGVSANARLHLTNCSFSGWKTGVLGYGYAWVNIQTSRFTDNETGFHFNSKGASVSHTLFTGNEFIGNQTGVLLESVPTDVTITFDECKFAKNLKDIDNRCNQDIDISQAVFQ